ncbi:MAG: MATE family efflux transporter [Proteobacteria bacterium]|nr:MATE family efflux transporter [Pseudomonadota bacterium]
MKLFDKARQLVEGHFVRDLGAAFRVFVGLLWRSVARPDVPRLRLLLSLALPVVLARSSQSVIGFCDALMISPLGEDALAATTMGAVNVFALIILPIGMAFIVQSFASQLYGKGDLLGARRYAWYGLVLAGLVALLALAAIPLIGPVLSLFPHQPSVREAMTDYLTIRIYAVGAVVATEVLGNWYGGLGNTRLHMFASMVAMVLNVALNWLLIQGNLGFPALGVEGAAWASVIASWAAFALLALVFLMKWAGASVSGKLGLNWSEFVRMLRFGAPNGINWFLEFAAFTIFLNVVVADLGPVVQASMMVVIQINSVSFMPAFGIGSAGAILVGQAIGRGDRDDVASIVGQTAAVAGIWQVSIGIVYLAIPSVLMGWFAPPTENGPEFLELGITMLIISAAWQLFDSWAMTLSEALRGAGDTAWCMWARLTLAWFFFIPGSIVAVQVLHGGPIAAVVSFVVYIGLLAFLLIYRFYTGAWRNIDLTGGDRTDNRPALDGISS